MSTRPGIYVEIRIREKIDAIWRLTQTPASHERWDLRFSRIEYLPKDIPDEPQRFIYETRIGFGLKISGTGESVGQRVGDGDATSALRFESEDAKSLIRVGSGYWKYVQGRDAVRFLTWYDYSVRFGVLGAVMDRVAFRPLMGWATAWSFDRLRLWVEEGQSPEVSLLLAVVYALARVTIAGVWVWHGLVPKLMFRSTDELAMLKAAGVRLSLLPWIGVGEIVFGVLFLLMWRARWMLVLNGVLMVAALAGVAVTAPEYVKAAFNPVTLNGCVIALSAIGWLVFERVPSAKRCLRVAPKEER